VADPAIPSGSDAVDALRAGILRGVPTDPDTASRLGDEALRRVFRQVLAERPAIGRERIADIARRDGGRVGDLAVEALGKWGGAEAAEWIASLEESPASPARRKALRRARHFCTAIHGRSCASGPGRPETEAPTSAVAGSDPGEDSAWMTAPGMLGSRVWVFRRMGPPSRLAVIAISDTRGVRDFTWQDGRDDAFARYQARLVAHGHRLSPVPWTWLVRRLAEAERRNGVRSEALPPNWSVVRDWVDLDAAVAAPPIEHPARPPESVLQLSELPVPAEVTGLLELPETAEWILPPHAFEGREKELAEAGRSQLVLEGMDPQTRVQQVVGAAMDDYLATDERAAWTERLLDLAHVLTTSDRERAGEVASLIAIELEADDRSPLAAAFLWALIGRAIGITPGGAGLGGGGEASEGTGPRDDGLIVP